MDLHLHRVHFLVNNLFGGLTLDPAGMHCPAGDDAFVSSLVSFGSPTSRAGGRIVTILHLVDVFCAKGVPFGG